MPPRKKRSGAGPSKSTKTVALTRANLESHVAETRQRDAQQRGEPTPSPEPDLHRYIDEGTSISECELILHFTASEEAAHEIINRRRERRMAGEPTDEADNKMPETAFELAVHKRVTDWEQSTREINEEIREYHAKKDGKQNNQEAQSDRQSRTPKTATGGGVAVFTEKAQGPLAGECTEGNDHVRAVDEGDVVQKNKPQDDPKIQEFRAKTAPAALTVPATIEQGGSAADHNQQNNAQNQKPAPVLLPSVTSTRQGEEMRGYKEKIDEQMAQFYSSKPRPPVSLFPPDFPRYYESGRLTEVSAYLANAAYVISLSGPPASDLKYGIIVVPAGEEMLLLGNRQHDAFDDEILKAVAEKKRALNKQEGLHEVEVESDEFRRRRFVDEDSNLQDAKEEENARPHRFREPGFPPTTTAAAVNGDYASSEHKVQKHSQADQDIEMAMDDDQPPRQASKGDKDRGAVEEEEEEEEPAAVGNPNRTRVSPKLKRDPTLSLKPLPPTGAKRRATSSTPAAKENGTLPKATPARLAKRAATAPTARTSKPQGIAKSRPRRKLRGQVG